MMCVCGIRPCLQHFCQNRSSSQFSTHHPKKALPQTVPILSYTCIEQVMLNILYMMTIKKDEQIFGLI